MIISNEKEKIANIKSFKYNGRKYFIEFFEFNYPIKSMLITLGNKKICAISNKLTSKEKSNELHKVLKGKHLKVIRGII